VLLSSPAEKADGRAVGYGTAAPHQPVDLSVLRRSMPSALRSWYGGFICLSTAKCPNYGDKFLWTLHAPPMRWLKETGRRRNASSGSTFRTTVNPEGRKTPQSVQVPFPDGLFQLVWKVWVATRVRVSGSCCCAWTSCREPWFILFGDEAPEMSRFRLCRLARIFGKFLANGFLSEGTASGKSENHRINTWELWWAWVDLNHRPRPYQGRALAT
jgi:hypothetical protein